ncbi:hypothetical protein OG778_34370 (plasmid) [Streptomyces sp. NBC_00184]|uniref:hypothetical protein n=1 Tax=Streptomyces sp. NBC_00184 TaxID=2975673 RepID=UPI002E2D5A9D|nr:hypothetical protein [Streptomyces sp. NBC_00184]
MADLVATDVLGDRVHLLLRPVGACGAAGGGSAAGPGAGAADVEAGLLGLAAEGIDEEAASFTSGAR